jgi:hypothetical protein
VEQEQYVRPSSLVHAPGRTRFAAIHARKPLSGTPKSKAQVWFAGKVISSQQVSFNMVLNGVDDLILGNGLLNKRKTFP